ncbi:DNA replication complex GINS protein-like protein psf3 [Dipodascopsis uninucleata]
MNNYYSIDDILTDGHKIPTVFQIDVPGMGYLEHGRSTNTDIEEGACIELPLWMSEVLAITGISDELPVGFITVSTPLQFNSKVVNAIKADAVTVDIKALCSQFFKLGERWLSMTGDESLLEVLMEAFKKRSALINDHAYNTRLAMIADSTAFLAKLDETELQLYRRAHDSSKDLRKWISSKR